MPVVACAWLQGSPLSVALILLGCIVGLWTSAILIANEFPDMRADAGANKRTLVVRLGRRAPWLYFSVQTLAAVALGYIQWLAGWSLWSLAVPILLILAAAHASPKLISGRPAQSIAIKTTLISHLLGGIWLAAMVALA
ncbi:MAG TPA: prenyltransferase [Rhodospirillaceae bacterium]|nr:prenyltransferase [Rhodospirillaceae bacterium]